jgi:hypothetical protein
MQGYEIIILNHLNFKQMATGYILTDHPTLLKFLDERNYTYELIGNSITAVTMRRESDLFYIGMQYQQFLDEQKTLELENDLYERSAE